jgi:inorganic pyrophosphatase
VKKAIERLEAFDKGSHWVNAIVETPKCSRVKYAYSPESGLFRLKRAMPEGMAFPFNYGFIPSTLGKDGDPLDMNQQRKRETSHHHSGDLYDSS